MIFCFYGRDYINMELIGWKRFHKINFNEIMESNL